MFKPSEDTKKILCFVGFIAAVVAVFAGASVLVSKLVKKKTCKKYYIECDCDESELPENTDENGDEPKAVKADEE